MHVRSELALVVADHHRATPEHVRGSNQHRVATVSATSNASATPFAMPPRGRFIPSCESSASNRPRSSADRSRRPKSRAADAALRQRHRELQRRLPPELDDDAGELPALLRPLTLEDVLSISTKSTERELAGVIVQFGGRRR